MPQTTCPRCQKPFTAPAGTSAQVSCPHCRKATEAPARPASRWFFARDRKKYGPYTWRQLLTLAQRGDVRPDDLLLQEGTKQWVGADTLPALFAPVEAVPAPPGQTPGPGNDQGAVSAASRMPPAGKQKTVRRALPWLVAGSASAGLGALVGFGVLIAFIYFPSDRPNEGQHANQDGAGGSKKKKNNTDLAPGKDADASKKERKNEDKKKTPEPSRSQQTDQFVERLNRYRQAAGLGLVTLDPELSRDCLAHAKYLSRHLDPAKADASNVYEEDPEKAGYSAEGELAGRNAIVALLAPMPALERCMGRLLSRPPLLNPEMQTIGVGFDKNERGDCFCVVDTQRGRSEPIVVYPAPKQTDVPVAFSGGTDVPDDNAPAGFPITVLFPPIRQVTAAQMELRDLQGKAIDGWVWTSEKPARPGQKPNAIALIAKKLLESNTLYQVKASAQVDGKPWSLAWSFTTEDDSDSKGIWAKKALDKVNAYRAGAGLRPVVLDDALSRGCLKHARYLVINEGHKSLLGLNAHKEDPKLPGYSEEGHAAGVASDIGIGDYEPIDAVDAWMATLYHRVPILEPNLKSIGFGCARGRRQGWATVLNVGSGRDKNGSRPHAVFYPAPDQVGVPLNFPQSGEEPNPIVEDKDGRAGYPVTAFFPQMEPLKNALGKLTNDKGNEVPCWFSAPEMPANPKYARNQDNTVCLIAKDPLAPNTTYHVQLQGTRADKPWQKKWKFTTLQAGLSTETATRSVVERINKFRVQAGLNAVVLDDAQARGCQLHAEYLAKNADALLKAKTPVNDEDPKLPWFTLEGLRAARQSLVFTNAPTPVLQIDDLMATFTSRIYLLDPSLQRIGFGCAHDVGRGWRCVLDPNGGRGDARIILFPAPKQDDVPLVGFDRIDETKGNVGFPIGVAFPQRATVSNVQAELKDADKKSVDVWISSPEKRLNDKLQRNNIGVHPQEPLRAGQTYSVTIAAVVNGKEWRETWQFTTTK